MSRIDERKEGNGGGDWFRFCEFVKWIWTSVTRTRSEMGHSPCFEGHSPPNPLNFDFAETRSDSPLPSITPIPLKELLLRACKKSFATRDKVREFMEGNGGLVLERGEFILSLAAAEK